MFANGIPESAFENCNKLKTVNFTNDFTKKASLTNNTNIYTLAFAGCSSLTRFDIPEGINYVDDKAFYPTDTNKNMKLETLVIPESYDISTDVSDRRINIYSFCDTSLLKNIISLEKNLYIGIVFNRQCNITSDAKLYAYINSDLQSLANRWNFTLVDITTVDLYELFGIGEPKETIQTSSTNSSEETSTTESISNSSETDTSTTIEDISTETSSSETSTSSTPIETTITTSPEPTTVNPVNPVIAKTTVTLDANKATVYRTGKTTIKATVKNGQGKTTYKSSNTKIAKVSSKGVVTAVKAGTAKITITNNNVSKVFIVTVKNPTLNIKSVNLYVKKTATIKITGQIGTAKFTTSDKKIATVNSKGKITAKKKGTATITVKTNGITLKTKVTVKNPKINVKNKNGYKLTLKKGKTFKLKITGKVGNAKFTTNNKKVAKVNSKGKITAKKKGNAIITIKTNGITLKCKVKVK
jgi:hypothetical protein